MNLVVLSSYYWRKKIWCKLPCFPDKWGNASENKFILEELDLLSHLWKIVTSENFAYNYEPFKISESLLHFFRANSYSLNFFLFWFAIIFLIKDFLLILLSFYFAFKSFSKLASISSNTNLKRDIACVLVLCLLHVVGAVASVICHRWGVCLIEPEHDKKQQMTCAPSEDSDQPGHQPSLISLCWVL